jgi:thioredoxin
MKRLSCLLPLLVLTGCDKLKDSLGSGTETKTAGTPSLHSTDLSDDEVDAFTRRSGQVVILDFHAEWCAPCRNLGPKLERIAGEFGDKVALGKVNVDHANAAAAKFGVSSIPDVRIFLNGVQVDRIVGDAPEDELRRKIQPLASRVTGKSGDVETGTPAANPSGEPSIQPMGKDWMPPGIERK